MNKLHVITGATSGVGRAVASLLAEKGAEVLGLGRNAAVLADLEERHPGRFRGRQLDLLDDGAIAEFAGELRAGGAAVRALILCAGVYFPGALASAPAAESDAMYRINVRARMLLAQYMLPSLEAPGAYLISMNSSAGLNSRPGLGGYAASHHAMRALTDAWRQELGPRGIRVLSIHLGRTATPMIEKAFAHESRPYDPTLLLQPEDVARLVAFVLQQPQSLEMTELSMRSSVASY